MTPEVFGKLLEERIGKMRYTLDRKSEEYARDNDKLYNFKRAGAIQNFDAAEALKGMLTKHIVSVYDMVKDWPSQKPSFEMIDEKIGDCINYLCLLEAIFKEDRL